MKKIGQRDGGEVEEQEQDARPEGAWFENEPLFIDDVEPVQIDIPGRPGEFITIQQVSDGVAKGRSRFYRTQTQSGGKKGPDLTTTTADAEALSLYVREAAIVDFKLGKRAGEQLYKPHSPGENRAVYKKWTGKFGAWVDEQIAKLNGWTDEEDEKRERFPEAAA